jgi:PIN domain nuclease of toxin-antitoxin system
MSLARLLLDTHVLLWAVNDFDTLSKPVTDAIAASSSQVFVSAASLWELRIKQSIGKLVLPDNFYQELEPAGFSLLGIGLEHIERYGQLPMHHRDPFDRMLIAQAAFEHLTLATRDPAFAAYEVALMRA